MEYQFFPNILCLLHCVPLYVCRLSINFQDLCASLLGMAALRILFLTFISRFVIDFLSIRKVIIFSAIATDDRHPLRSRSIHQNVANCMTIRFRYIAQPRGYGKPTAHAHVIMFEHDKVEDSKLRRYLETFGRALEQFLQRRRIPRIYRACVQLVK